MEDHKHIPFHGGHITWHSDKPPSKEMIKAFESLRVAALRMLKAEEKNCEYCGGSGFDPYPNHDTTMRPCPECQP